MDKTVNDDQTSPNDVEYYSIQASYTSTRPSNLSNRSSCLSFLNFVTSMHALPQRRPLRPLRMHLLQRPRILKLKSPPTRSTNHAPTPRSLLHRIPAIRTEPRPLFHQHTRDFVVSRNVGLRTAKHQKRIVRPNCNIISYLASSFNLFVYSLCLSLGSR